MRVILKATSNLSDAHIIGHGDFGTVYDATLLPDRQEVAIKRLHGSYQFICDRQFAAEMETIGKLEHDNLVPLLGYSARGDERFLIYKRMHHGSLQTWLRNQGNTPGRQFGWPDRLKILLGSARGLVFLHRSRITHRDIKSSNILLDELMRPRVSDFCLARIISGYETRVRTGASGSHGYIPPEYFLTMKGTAKGDVYSFGVVMLEVLTGRPPAGQEMEEEGGGNLVGWVRWMVAHGREGELFDPCLPASGMWRNQMVRALAVAQECTADEPWKRPAMGSVVDELKADVYKRQAMGSVVDELKAIQLIKDEPRSLQGRVVQA
ncbi:Leucine-rich repeat receptor protein kinase MSP1 [Dichanthelium oligosanthes]|uniref:Leucine-rich repeat receptor protein kinase MSP1 n=1 Tax=Dichanthelium oligosanthes TaxID=888268 RepID=A0A1E5VMC3_9POAL|nr:Leucine-rich repeat receptor protein kinase MSP1 [Dichanthelium oligosanthes]